MGARNSSYFYGGNMEEQFKIIIDKNGHIHVWSNGIKQRNITKIKLEASTESVPTIEIKKDILPRYD